VRRTPTWRRSCHLGAPTRAPCDAHVLRAFVKLCSEELYTVKTIIATALIVLGLMSSAAQAASPFQGYPDWARTMFERSQVH
jgi:hypothetical protein